MKISLYNKKGKTDKNKTLPDEIFNIGINSDLIYQVVTSQQSNRRQNSAHTKDRSEKRGGGKKPWRQKGTGRARHGSRRSSIWSGGGVTFGPRNERNYKKKINKKERRKALFMTLSGKADGDFLIILDKLNIKKPKTKELSFLNNLPCKDESVLIATDKVDGDLLLAARNIPNVEIMEARNLNALDVLSYKYLLLPEKSVETIKETFYEKHN